MKIAINTSSHKVCENDPNHPNHFDVEWVISMFCETQAERDALLEQGNSSFTATVHACVPVGSSHAQMEVIAQDATKAFVAYQYPTVPAIQNGDFTWMS